MEYEYEMEQKLKNSLVDEFDTEEFWKTKLPPDSEDIMKKLNPIAVYTNKKDLFSLLHKGVFFDNRERVNFCLYSSNFVNTSLLYLLEIKL